MTFKLVDIVAGSIATAVGTVGLLIALFGKLGWKNINKDHKILNSNTQWSNNI